MEAPEPAGRRRANALVGVGAALVAVFIWSGWIVDTRHAATASLSPATLALIRFAVPAAILFPAWRRVGLIPRGRLLPCFLCFLGSGASFAVAAGYAMQRVPVADAAPLLSGFTPLAATSLSFVCLGERPGRWRAIGAACIAFGALALIGGGATERDGIWPTQLLLILCACGWASYTLALPRTGMSAAAITGLVGVWSTLVLLPFGLPGVVGLIRDGGRGMLGQLVLIQGLGSGLLAMVAFAAAVGRLGAPRAAVFPGLVPATAAVLGIFFLAEWPDAVAWTGIMATGVGVVLANGIGAPDAGTRDRC